MGGFVDTLSIYVYLWETCESSQKLKYCETQIQIELPTSHGYILKGHNYFVVVL